MIACRPGGHMISRPSGLVTKAEGALQGGVAVDEMGTIQEILAQRSHLRDLKFVHYFLAETVHLRTGIDWQGHPPCQLDDLVKVSHFERTQFRIRDVPIAVRNNV